MRFAVRLAILGVGCGFVGCGFAKKPYADDPLLRGGRAAWLSRDATPATTPPKQFAVEPPQPPTTPVVTSQVE